MLKNIKDRLNSVNGNVDKSPNLIESLAWSFLLKVGIGILALFSIATLVSLGVVGLCIWIVLEASQVYGLQTSDAVLLVSAGTLVIVICSTVVLKFLLSSSLKSSSSDSSSGTVVPGKGDSTESDAQIIAQDSTGSFGAVGNSTYKNLLPFCGIALVGGWILSAFIKKVIGYNERAKDRDRQSSIPALLTTLLVVPALGLVRQKVIDWVMEVVLSCSSNIRREWKEGTPKNRPQVAKMKNERTTHLDEINLH